MKNVMVQVVNTDRTRMNDILNAFGPVIKKLKQFFTQVNHVDFISETSIDGKLELINQFSFKIGIQSYSNVGRMSTFDINLQEATVTPDDYVQQEINFNLNGNEENTVQTEKETLDSNSNTTTPSSSYQNSADVQDFTMERCNVDSTHDQNSLGDNSSSDTSSDDESTQEISMNTTTVENRFFTVPNSTLFSVDTMITKTEIIKILHLGSARQRKLTHKKDHKSKSKKVKFKFNNDRNDAIARSIRFANDHIINGALEVKDAHLSDASLSQAEEFKLDCTDN